MTFISPLVPFAYCPELEIGRGPDGLRVCSLGELRRAATGDYILLALINAME